MSASAKRYRSLFITLLAVAATNFAISFAADLTTKKAKMGNMADIDAPRPKMGNMADIDAPRPKMGNMADIDAPRP